ncbi:hypothetical protein ACH5RR_036545 [Cinchona calisaya]|uniref:SWIM-type domain-containing protein n=1 Tax=Cinchona calisaya TaxID=153742 RepID=A0ABD2Y4Y7_9GENT
MIPHKANDTLYEVACPYGDVYAVNVSERTYSCRKWDLTGILCPHDCEGIVHGIDDNQVLEGTQEAPTQGEAQRTQDAYTEATQEPSTTVVSKSAKRSMVLIALVADAFKRLCDAVETLTCSTPAKNPICIKCLTLKNLFQVTVVNHPKGIGILERKELKAHGTCYESYDGFCLGIAFVWE